ncbi:CRISPR-associated protein, Crm2 family [Halothece sp. PCC 7418]|uniref:type III-B CRISPR-associated protein Cas10/Cmr2 n=1 Tax=Halothece sp. (strain PCC 7418) TaxID=65093 RepID=UPI0002A06085|nr:type III-B CRISPR-associated protein Cas10/Cmr2 [Halothece sp. PCC 7418]AFZ42899.1 CRISPR-associated protein, Crm2 family [Halothece sp. PCC 7418]
MTPEHKIKIALAWCLRWGDKIEPAVELAALKQMRRGMMQEKPDDIPASLQPTLDLVDALQGIPDENPPETLTEIREQYPQLWHNKTPIGLIYGGATKIKGYVFSSPNLTEIRGASAILDRINLVDFPAFFNQNEEGSEKDFYRARSWLGKTENYPQLLDVLIPELIIYSTGGNILAFCPAAYVDDLANAIEKRYTTETLTANSCAVGDTFRLLELRFGLLQTPPENTLWLNWYQQYYHDPIIESYYGKVDEKTDLKQNFYNRKSFNELVGKLTSLFNQRRSGNRHETRPSRCYPPMLETHPYLVRDSSDRASAMTQVTTLASEPYFSEPTARKYVTGQQAKRDNSNLEWYDKLGLDWQPGEVESWVKKFETFLERSDYFQSYYQDCNPDEITEARNLEEIANASNDFISFIYADGNNMGRYIQKIRTPEAYQQFSNDIFEATEQSVYYALAQHLSPHQLGTLKKPESKYRAEKWVHPFEIITIGGDDVLLIVPANKALEIAKTIGEKLEEILVKKGRYTIEPDPNSVSAHRYSPEAATPSQCELSMSIGVLTLGYKTPIYYAQNLANQLLKLAKKRAKDLKQHYHYYGGTVDILALKSVNMISSNIPDFRDNALQTQDQKRHLYATPYTLHELGGLIATIQAFQKAEFPRSQLYQIRSFLAQGKKISMLNYRYFAVRLSEQNNQQLLRDKFEQPWCQAKTNNGNLAPWMFDSQQGIYETIWNDLIDFYPFVQSVQPSSLSTSKL